MTLARRTESILLLILMLLVGLAGRAAAGSAGTGFKAGWNQATLSGDGTGGANVSSINGAMVAWFLRFSVGAGFAIQPEVLYSRKGVEGDTLDIRGAIKLDYVEIPVLVRYQIPIESFFTPTVYAGAAASGLINANAEATVYGETRSIGIENRLSRFDVGVVLGVEIGVPSARRQATIEARYEQGLRSVDGADPPADVKNRVFSIILGVSFM